MKRKDIRKEQIALLHFEKTLPLQAEALKEGGRVNRLSLAGGLASVMGVSMVAAYKLGSLEPIAHASNAVVAYAANITQSDKLLVGVAEAISSGHAAVEQMAVESGLRLFEVGGGTGGKAAANVVVKSILGL